MIYKKNIQAKIDFQNFLFKKTIIDQKRRFFDNFRNIEALYKINELLKLY